MARTVVITGGSAGVGRATARAFAERGDRVGVIARGRERLEATVREIEALGGEGCSVVADVADADAVERAAAEIEEPLGPVDVWVNNAMATVMAPVKDITPDEFRRVLEVTFLGQVHGTLAALRRMLPRDRGVIVQVGSALAYRGIPLQAPYCAAKHAVQGFVDSLRSELLHDGSRVKVCMVQLPALNTPQFAWARNKMPETSQPVPPIFQPEVAARAIVHVAEHPRRKELYVGWPTVEAIVGNEIAPRLADRVLARKGYIGQQTGTPNRPGRPDNLWDVPPGDPGAHGDFDDRARPRSLQLWANTHRGWVALGALALAGAALAGAVLAGEGPGGRAGGGRPRIQRSRTLRVR